MATNHQEIAECLARLGAAFGSAAKCLATASDSLSSAAQALAEAAQSISEMSRAMNPTSDISQAHTSLQEESVADGVLDISDSESEGEDGADRAGAVGASVSGVTWMNGHSAEASVSTDLTLCNNIFPSQVSTALHYYITLKEDFDVLPLIGHVANQNRKTVCFISHHKNLGPYQSIVLS
ncbi:hypothetical protein BDV93DRAFT_48549 [Ceratobasidium sp. AG-I]|nr:hypothetical protein BDV93DRAFT_48549 [Ceratobasidium sp. AG-I]